MPRVNETVRRATRQRGRKTTAHRTPHRLRATAKQTDTNTARLATAEAKKPRISRIDYEQSDANKQNTLAQRTTRAHNRQRQQNGKENTVFLWAVFEHTRSVRRPTRVGSSAAPRFSTHVPSQLRPYRRAHAPLITFHMLAHDAHTAGSSNSSGSSGPRT